MVETEEILSIARETLETEGRAILDLSGQIGDSFVLMARHIHGLRGRLILTGVGKSAHIAQKLSATFNSIGTPSVFMHPTDSTHGDLGMVTPDDSVLILSKSGNTPEIKALVPLLRSMGTPVLSIVSDEGSYLAGQSLITIQASFSHEACPNNLAPTTSTAVQLAVGDALAMVLYRLNEFTSKDFARLHPGGLLGKRLNLTVADLYTHNDRPAVSPGDPIRDVILEISSKRLGATAVLDSAGRIAGIITDGDLRRMMHKYEDLREVNAEMVMSPHPRTIAPGDLAVQALELMRTNSITQLLVVSNDEYLGIIHIHDILREGII